MICGGSGRVGDVGGGGGGGGGGCLLVCCGWSCQSDYQKTLILLIYNKKLKLLDQILVAQGLVEHPVRHH